MSRSNGTVKWFSQEKGFGFITRDDGPDVFVHHTSLPGTGFRKLDQGERVEFDVIEEPKGLKAQNVTRSDSSAAADPDAQPREWATRPSGAEARRPSGERGGWNRGADDHRTSGAPRGGARSGGWNRDTEGWRGSSSRDR
jgi:cold shock protein